MTEEQQVTSSNTYQDKEDVREAVLLLLDNYWIIREEQADEYALIRRNEPELRRYFFEKCGWRLLQNPQFYKLEKIPAKPQTWMGFSEFREPRDYALLCCVMAFLQEKGPEERFLLSELCESVAALYPSDITTLNWENYEHRRSLVRVLSTIRELGMLLLIDGDSEKFAADKDDEVLYEASVLSRYFLRSYPKDMQHMAGWQDLLQEDTEDVDSSIGKNRRNRIYRQLLLTPALYQAEAESEDFAYLRNMNRRLREELEVYTGMQFDLYRDCAMLTNHERVSGRFFPQPRNGIHGVMLHMAAYWRDTCKEKNSDVPLSLVEWEQCVDGCRRTYGSGWTKEYRDLTINRLAAELLTALAEWHFAVFDQELGQLMIRPALGRFYGQYPADYREKGGSKHDK